MEIVKTSLFNIVEKNENNTEEYIDEDVHDVNIDDAKAVLRSFNILVSPRANFVH